MIESNKVGSFGIGWKKWKVKGFKPKKGGNKTNLSENKRKRGKSVGKQSRNMNCFNCRKPGHFAGDYIEPKVIYDQIHFHNAFVSSFLMLTETVPCWTVNSAATNHIAWDRNAYVDFCRIPKGSRSIYMGNNTSANVLRIGSCKLLMRKGCTFYFHDVLFASEIRRNLVSVVVLVKLSFKIVFEQDYVTVLLDNIVYGNGFLLDRFIVLDTIPINKTIYVFAIGNSSSRSYVNDVKWHARLGHIGQDRLKRLAKADLLGYIDKIDLPVCEQCLEGKATRLPFGKAKRACFPLELIRSEICGPMNVRVRHGA